MVVRIDTVFQLISYSWYRMDTVASFDQRGCVNTRCQNLNVDNQMKCNQMMIVSVAISSVKLFYHLFNYDAIFC